LLRNFKLLSNWAAFPRAFPHFKPKTLPSGDWLRQFTLFYSKRAHYYRGVGHY
jgi:hypothetical protein